VDVYEVISSPGCTLSEQIARQVFDLLPEDGLIVAIMDRQGNYWVNDAEEFSKLNISMSVLEELWAKVNDGAEPITIQASDFCVTTAQLATERTNCGYVLIAQRWHKAESISMMMELVEVILCQMDLIAGLIEKNNLLHELELKRYSEYGSNIVALN
jgi:hypothetical protein